MFDWLFGNSRAEDRIDRILDGLRQPMWRSDFQPSLADMVMPNATLYDYNRHGVVAFKADNIDTDLMRRWADGRVKLTIAVYVQDDDST
jgi:hypothetical protein